MRRWTLFLGTPVLFAASLAAQAASFAPPADFGVALAVRNGTALVGRSGGALGSIYPSAGAIHLFERRGGAWSMTGQFSGADVRVGDQFGSAVAATESLVLVGAPGRNAGRGGGYLFAESGGQWRQVAVLDPGADSGAAAGTAVAIAGDLLALGAPSATGAGSVFLFRRSGTTWTLLTRLSGRNAGPADAFGRSVSLSAGRLVVGAPADSGGRGAVYVFQPRGDAWSVAAVLRRAQAETGDRLGESIAGLPDGVAAGAPGVSQSRGRVAVFRPQGSGWAVAGEVAAPDTGRGIRFGSSLAVDGGRLWVGATGVARGRGGVWLLPAAEPLAGRPEALETTGLAIGDRFGTAVAVAGGVAAVAAASADAQSGAVVIFEQGGGAWRQATKLHEPPAMAYTAMTGSEVRCTEGKVGAFTCSDVDLLSFIPLSAIGGKPGVIANDIWGWTDPETSREYALVGRSDGTAFVDVTDPSSPRYVAELPMHEGAHANLWRDIKVYRDHAFIVADGAGPHGVQIVDLRQLRRLSGPAPVLLTETAHYAGIASAHNIVINEETGFAFTVGSNGGGETCGGGLHMIDVRNPTAPVFAGCFGHTNTGRARTGYSHDAQCVLYRGPDEKYRGREICLSSNETALSISDITDKASPVPISSAAYPSVAYAHQGWLSDDHRYFFMGDEADEVAGGGSTTRTLVWDVSDLDDPVLATEYRATTHAIDHNQYVKGNYLYQSNLLAGLRILDVSDPTRPREVGFFDTVPWDEDQTGFGGSWSNYPYLRSGAVAVSSWNEGLFILKRRERPVP